MQWVKCKKCNAKLMRLSYGQGEIKCKCGNIQKFKIVTQRLLRIMEFFSPT